MISSKSGEHHSCGIDHSEVDRQGIHSAIRIVRSPVNCRQVRGIIRQILGVKEEIQTSEFLRLNRQRRRIEGEPLGSVRELDPQRSFAVIEERNHT